MYFLCFTGDLNFIQIDGLQLHYIDEGGKNDPIILFLHGVPTWSFTFRKIFPFCIDSGYRVIAPDLPGELGEVPDVDLLSGALDGLGKLDPRGVYFLF